MFIERDDDRKHERVLCSSLLEIVLPTDRHLPAPVVGVVEDISERGLCISVEVPLRPGSTVELNGTDQVIHATVKHCNSDEAGGYHVGLEFTPSFEWAAGSEWPEHLA